MYIFDTDHLSLIQRNGADGKRILARLATINDPEVAVTVITFGQILELRTEDWSRSASEICSSNEDRVVIFVY